MGPPFLPRCFPWSIECSTASPLPPGPWFVIDSDVQDAVILPKLLELNSSTLEPNLDHTHLKVSDSQTLHWTHHSISSRSWHWIQSWWRFRIHITPSSIQGGTYIGLCLPKVTWAFFNCLINPSSIILFNFCPFLLGNRVAVVSCPYCWPPWS